MAGGHQEQNVRRISERVSCMLGRAVGLYTEGKFEEAINVYLEIIKINPNLPEAYHTIGAIYEEVCVVYVY